MSERGEYLAVVQAAARRSRAVARGLRLRLIESADGAQLYRGEQALMTTSGSTATEIAARTAHLIGYARTDSAHRRKTALRVVLVFSSDAVQTPSVVSSVGRTPPLRRFYPDILLDSDLPEVETSELSAQAFVDAAVYFAPPHRISLLALPPNDAAATPRTAATPGTAAVAADAGKNLQRHIARFSDYLKRMSSIAPPEPTMSDADAARLSCILERLQVTHAESERIWQAARARIIRTGSLPAELEIDVPLNGCSDEVMRNLHGSLRETILTVLQNDTDTEQQ